MGIQAIAMSTTGQLRNRLRIHWTRAMLQG